MIEVRQMTVDDVDFGLELCRLSNWNQTRDDWLHLLELEPEGMFVAECDGRLCGTASTTAYGRRAAWIGMVLVHPDFRRRGIGSALMTRCIHYLQQAGLESIKLDATDQGRPVYLKLGFLDERQINRYRRPAGPLSAAPPAAGRGSLELTVRQLAAEDWPSIAAIDAEAFGADRLPLLKLLARDGRALVAEQQGRLLAYGFSRRGHLADYLGPVVAVDAGSARPLVSALLQGMAQVDVFWDLMPDNAAALELAATLGFVEVRSLMRMYLGQAMNPGRVEQTFAAADFALG